MAVSPIRLITVGVALFTASFAASQSDQQIDSAIAAVKPALVRIYVAEVAFRQGRETKSESAGSGAIISADGYVVTNHHVAGWAKRLVCTLTDRSEVEADLVGTDPLTDISVLKLRRTGDRQFPFANWGDSSKLNVGDTVFAMGSPLALSQSVTKGIVSNVEMVMPDFLGEVDMSLDGEDVGSMVLWLGHDAAIFPGNSGGPLVNSQGEIIGINELEFGLSGAIPSNLAREVANELIANGKVKRATLGLSVQPLLKSSGKTKGALLGGTVKDGPAAKSGLLSGDIILEIAGKPSDVRFLEEMPAFNKLVASLPIGESVKVVIERGGERKELQIVPTEREPSQPKPVEVKACGIVVADISPVLAREMKRPDSKGVLIDSIRPGGPLGESKPQLKETDVIVAVNGKPVTSVSDFQKVVAETVKPELMPVRVTMAVERGVEQILTVAVIDRLEDEDQSKEARKAFLGASTQVLLGELAKALNVEGRKGFRVTSVLSGSPADKAGLKVGDLLFGIDDIPFEASQAEDADELAEIVRQYDIGSEAVLRIWRDGKIQPLKVTLGESPTSIREMRKLKDEDFEFTVRDLSGQDREGKQLGSVAGILVEDVSQGGWAALGKLLAQDVILSVGAVPVGNLEDFEKTMAAAKASKPKHIVLRVLRGINELFIEMETDWSVGQ